MKRRKIPGTSARTGRAPAPYTKYRKKPYKYDMNALKKAFPNKPVGRQLLDLDIPNHGWMYRRQGNA